MPSYLELLETRAASKRRPLTRVPLCLDPGRYETLQAARENLRDSLKAQPAAPTQSGTRRPGARLADTDPAKDARVAVEAAEDAVREASLKLVLEGKSADEIKDAELAEGDKYGIILLALKGVEDLDGNPIPEITPDKVVQLLPTLTSGELSMIYAGITMASGAPDFPTSRRS